MTQSYIGTKIIAAWPQEKDGELGYAVRYPDGYVSWSPKGTFEAAYRPISSDEAGLIQTYGTSDPYSAPPLDD